MEDKKVETVKLELTKEQFELVKALMNSNIQIPIGAAKIAVETQAVINGVKA